MKSLCAVALFLLPLSLFGQDVVFGKQITPEELKKAQDQLATAQKTIDLAKGGTQAQINIGEFLTISPPENIPGPFLFVVNNEDVIKRIEIAAATKFSTYMKHFKDPAITLHEYEPMKQAWTQVVGVAQGKTCITVIANGSAGKAPVIIDKIFIVVGKPIPPPPPPDADPLLKAAALDIAAGKGTQDDVDFYREYLMLNVSNLPVMAQYKTSKDFWTAFHAGVDSKIKGNLPSMRRMVGDVLNKEVPEKENDAFDQGRREKIAACLKTLADRMETK